MNDFFNYDGPFFRVLNRIGDLVILNLLWILCCIPIVTIGASTTALYYNTIKMAAGEESYIARGFFRSFRENFRQSTIIWLIMLVTGCLVAFDLYASLYWEWDPTLEMILVPVSFIATLIWLMIFVYVFPLQCKFVNPIKATFKNALILGFAHLPSTILFIAVLVASVVGVWSIPMLFPVWLVIGAAAEAFGLSFVYKRIFNIYIKKPETEALEDDGSGIAPEDRWEIPEEYDDPAQLITGDEAPAEDAPGNDGAQEEPVPEDPAPEETFDK